MPRKPTRRRTTPARTRARVTALDSNGRSLATLSETWGTSLPESVSPPHGRVAVEEFVGFDRVRHLGVDGRFTPAFEREHIVRVALPAPLLYAGTKVTRVACHVRIARYVTAAFVDVFQEELWGAIEQYGGSFEPRLIRGGRDWSMHSFGIAFDFDPARNPLGAEPGDTFIGSTQEGGRLVRLFERWGFLWGGHFDGRKDCQHFQWCTGC